MKIRKLTAADDLTRAIELLYRFFSEEGFTTDHTTIASHAREMASLETCGLFAAEDGDKPVGIATVSLEFGIEYGWWAEMGDLYVLPEWRGHGISRALVAAAEEFLQMKGVAGYQVTITPYASEHHDLARYYKHLGFASEGRLILVKRFE